MENEILQSVKAAFDSVNLINKLNAETDKTKDDLDTISRNIEHLIVMMSKEWFVNALTSEQSTIITKIISD
jgi:methyl-accepting chemotaxis protein